MLRVEPRDARVLSVGRPEAALGLALLVVGVDVLDVEDGKRAAALVGERDAVALGRLGNRQADRQGPREAAAEPHGLDDALVVLPAHEAGERGEGTGGEHVQIGRLARGERDDRKRVEVVGTVARPWRERAAVGSDELVGGAVLTRAPRSRRAPAPRASGRRSARSPRESAPRCRPRSPALRRLVRVVDACEALDLAGVGLGVETVRVAPRTLLDRRVHVDLDERAELLHQVARLLARLDVGRDGGGDGGAAVARDARGDPADALDVRVAVFLREAEAFREVRADRVAVEVLDDVAALVERRADEVRDGGLAGAREPREPEREPASAGALGLGVLVGEDVVGHRSPSEVSSTWIPHSSLSEPAQRPALLLVRPRRPGAGHAADRAVAGVVQRVVGDLVGHDVAPDVLLRPVRERLDLPHAVAVGTLELLRVRA